MPETFIWENKGNQKDIIDAVVSHFVLLIT